MPKVLFPVYIELEQLNYLTKKAKETGRPKASIVREWIERCQKEEQEAKQK